MNTVTLAPILGTDKSNPSFSIYASNDGKNNYEVYFGLALLEKVNGNSNGIQFKYLLGRLYNAGINRKKLVEAFDISLSTIRRYGEAVKSDDPEKMMRGFAGQGAIKKLTPEIENYVRSEFKKIYPKNKYDYSSQIRSEVKNIFAVSLSAETLRPVFNDEKQIFVSIEKGLGKSLEESPEKGAERAGICECPESFPSANTNNRKYSLSNFDVSGNIPETFLLKHAGLTLLLPSIRELKLNSLAEQWIGSVLLGAMNIEQSGGLDFHALDLLFAAKTISSCDYQRSLLKALASDKDNIKEVLRSNAAFIGAGKSENIFYYDPHGIEYTGMKNILKGWCGSKGRIAKINYQDFMHTVDGCPVYFEIHDNYLDMRERLLDELGRFDSEILHALEKPTVIVDRGVYGKDKMSEMDARGYGLVTWDKNYKKDAWNEVNKLNLFKIKRYKNNSRSSKIWHVRFMVDNTWNTIANYHRILVRISPPDTNQEHEVPILSNGKINDMLAVKYMLNRWIQENDYAYLDRNFGINEITTYKGYDYSELPLKEKEVYSSTYDFLLKSKKQIDSQLKKLLLEREQKSMEDKSITFAKKEKIEELKKLVLELSREMTNAAEKVDKAEKLIKQDKKRLAHDAKYYMDAIKITARNLFYSLITKFRPRLDNYRNDHQLLRELIRAPGYIEYSDSVLFIRLHPDRNFQPRTSRTINDFLEMISDEINNKYPDRLPVKISLSSYMSNGYPGKKESVQSAIV